MLYFSTLTHTGLVVRSLDSTLYRFFFYVPFNRKDRRSGSEEGVNGFYFPPFLSPILLVKKENVSSSSC